MSRSNKVLWLRSSTDTHPAFSALPIPFVHTAEFNEPQMLRDWAAGKNRDQRFPTEPAEGVRTIRSIGERVEHGVLSTDRHLKIVISGSVEVTAVDGTRETLLPGDMVLSDDQQGDGHSLRYLGDCRVIELLVGDWAPAEVMPYPPMTWPAPSATREPSLLRMYSGVDGQSYFSTFTELFDHGSGQPTPWIPTEGFYFVSMGDPLFLDWHPEDDNNLVIVLSGELELHADSDGGVNRIFGPGDICLAEDLTGKGHTDYLRGGTKMLIARIPAEYLWPSNYQSVG
ncbi:hypothetical protein G8764_04470 [Pseudomaricurvus alcaniphilus]|uniref:hypothetical protein n=1 Tax=Pseudomaricurvus alcaniphilus TaxID=1166482 RepID=UPI0014078E51|nr:hypothetical protein [Pseudomaricurvus alcaniphilus]NHN36543.1 hypothetical protein [Pseudomaricurvus alcaniphilus]